MLLPLPQATPYWFGGRPDKATAHDEAARQWRAAQDLTFSTARTVLGDGGAMDPNLQPAAPLELDSHMHTTPAPPSVEGRTTISASLKSGAITGEQVEQMIRSRPGTATATRTTGGGCSLSGSVLRGGGPGGPEALQPVLRTGVSAGSTLKPPRPVSAFARLNPDSTSFTHVAHSGSAGLGMQRLERQMAVAEVAAVRGLY